MTNFDDIHRRLHVIGRREAPVWAEDVTDHVDEHYRRCLPLWSPEWVQLSPADARIRAALAASLDDVDRTAVSAALAVEFTRAQRGQHLPMVTVGDQGDHAHLPDLHATGSGGAHFFTGQSLP